MQTRLFPAWIFIAVWALCWNPVTSVVIAEEDVQVWEYAPYRVHLWYVFEPSVVESETFKRWFLDSLQRDLKRTFRATWDLHVRPLPTFLESELRGKFETITVPDLAERELVLAVSTTHPEARTIRTIQAACEAIPSISISSNAHAQLMDAAEQVDATDEPMIEKLFGKLNVHNENDEKLVDELSRATIPAALLPRRWTAEREGLRVLFTPFPWQTDWLLNEMDKVIFLSIAKNDDQYEVKVRELDCPMQYWGPTGRGYCLSWADANKQAGYLVARAFSPVARVESAEASTAQLRGRASGLVTADDIQNPSRFHVGDVLHPIIRRDDRSGVPTLLQPLDFTFAAVTNSDEVLMQANVYTYSGGPGLRGRQNPRTHRVLLRVRPQSEESDLQIVVRGNTQQAQAGCAIYLKDLVSDDFTYLGRTDWRGRLSLPTVQETVRILPAEIKSRRDTDGRKARDNAMAEARKTHDDLVNQAKSEGLEPPAFIPPVWEDSIEPIDPQDLISLSIPILQVYVKSGDTVLARLPVVPGIQAVQTAELPDDRLRLQSEALVRGFQGEILDLIGQRNLLAARVRLHVQRSNAEKAEKDLEQLRSLKDFNQMNDELSRIQRSILEQTDSSVPRSARAQIDRMFKTTRDLLQKYLQQDVVGETARILRESQQ